MKTFIMLGALVAALLVGAIDSHAGTDAYQWLFVKNRSNQVDSRLFMHGGCNTVVSYRSGSGLQQPGGMDECRTNLGWLPNGTYRIQGAYNNYPGTSVTGPAIYLGNKACYNGTLRTELFVHSSYPWSDSHYQSLGCIKLRSGGTAATATGDVRDAYNHQIYVNPNYLVVGE